MNCSINRASAGKVQNIITSRKIDTVIQNGYAIAKM